MPFHMYWYIYICMYVRIYIYIYIQINSMIFREDHIVCGRAILSFWVKHVSMDFMYSLELAMAIG